MVTPKKRKGFAALLDPSELLAEPQDAPIDVAPRPKTQIDSGPPPLDDVELEPLRRAESRAESMREFTRVPTRATYVSGPAEWGAPMPYVPPKPEEAPPVPSPRNPELPHRTKPRRQIPKLILIGVPTVFLGLGLVLGAPKSTPPRPHTNTVLTPQLAVSARKPEAPPVTPVSENVEKKSQMVEKPNEIEKVAATIKRSRAPVRSPSSAPLSEPKSKPAVRPERHPEVVEALGRRGLVIEDLWELVPNSRQTQSVDQLVRWASQAPISKSLVNRKVQAWLDSFRKASLAANESEALEADYFELVGSMDARVAAGHADRVLLDLQRLDERMRAVRR